MNVNMHFHTFHICLLVFVLLFYAETSPAFISALGIPILLIVSHARRANCKEKEICFQCAG